MEERKGFGSNFGFLMAAVGSAVGLGNIWGFPNKMGASGGFTFLIIYLILAVICGFIVMLGELALGRKTGKGAIAAYHAISKRFKWVGWLGVASAFLIMSFYCALGGYCIKYVVLNVGNLFGTGFGSNGMNGGDVFGAFLTNQSEGVIYGLIFVVLTMLIVMGGVSGGIEKFCGIGMPALFVMLLICIIRACTLPGAVNGLKYMFVPGWAVANGVIAEAPSIFEVISTAGGGEDAEEIGCLIDDAVCHRPAGNEHILQTIHGTLQRAGADDADEQHDEQSGHTHGADLLDTAADAAHDDEHGQSHEDQTVEDRLVGVCHEGTEHLGTERGAVGRRLLRQRVGTEGGVEQIADVQNRVLDAVAAQRTVEEQDEERGQDAQPADPLELLAQHVVRTDNALAGLTTQRQLTHHDDEAAEHCQDQIDDKEREATGGSHFIGEAPDVAQADRRTNSSH